MMICAMRQVVYFNDSHLTAAECKLPTRLIIQQQQLRK